MPDVYAIAAELDAATIERLIGVLETRAADPQQRALRRAFLAQVEFPSGARVLDVGCGTGALTRTLAGWPGVGEVVGVDPAVAFIARARELATAAGVEAVSFREADGRALPFEDGSFDVVVFDSVLCHVPGPGGPERSLAEALRTLRPGGWLAAFDGDYATTTVALGEHDPLQACAAATMANSVTDPWLVRRLPALASAAGFEQLRFRSHGYVETPVTSSRVDNSGGAERATHPKDKEDGGERSYMLTVVDRGAELLRATGRIGDSLAAALKAEARRRVAMGSFFGHIAYASLVARKGI